MKRPRLRDALLIALAALWAGVMFFFLLYVLWLNPQAIK